MKHLTITLLTLLMSMGVHAVYVPGSDDGGWIILLFFLGFWIFVAVAALFSNAKETIKENRTRRREERVKENKKREEAEKREKATKKLKALNEKNASSLDASEGNFSKNLLLIVLGSMILFILMAYFLANLDNAGDRTELKLEDLTKTEYTSVHNETYWFIEEKHNLEGSYVGSVRSNLIWADRMSVFIDQANCGLIQPQILLSLTTNKVKTDYPDFDFSSLEGKSMRLNLDFDGKYFEKINAQIISAFEFENGNHAVQLDLWKVYDTFLAIDDKYGALLGWQFLTLKILEDDPNRKYFNLPERQYRMLGFRGVMAGLIEQCKQDVRAK